jgi:hypothetical protein
MKLRPGSNAPSGGAFSALTRCGVTVASPQVRRDLRALEQRLAKSLSGARVASYGSTGDRFSTQIGAVRC